MYEVVEYRTCNCPFEDCPGEKETVLFQHKDKPQCTDFMKKKSCEPHIVESRHYKFDKDKIDIFFFLGRMKGIIRLRVQETKND